METTGVYVLLVANLVLTVAFAFLKPYLGRKGENVATKEDIGEITRIVKRIETDHTVEVEALKGTQQLRMAAVEKRLQAHQEAFTLWRRMLSQLESEKLPEAISNCSRWWEENCLYLEFPARRAFSTAFSTAIVHHMERQRGTTDAPEMLERVHEILAAGDVILGAVALPPLTASEKESARNGAQMFARGTVTSGSTAILR